VPRGRDRLVQVPIVPSPGYPQRGAGQLVGPDGGAAREWVPGVFRVWSRVPPAC
jgi:hypothetical protein